MISDSAQANEPPEAPPLRVERGQRVEIEELREALGVHGLLRSVLAVEQVAGGSVHRDDASPLIQHQNTVGHVINHLLDAPFDGGDELSNALHRAGEKVGGAVHEEHFLLAERLVATTAHVDETYNAPTYGKWHVDNEPKLVRLRALGPVVDDLPFGDTQVRGWLYAARQLQVREHVAFDAFDAALARGEPRVNIEGGILVQQQQAGHVVVDDAMDGAQQELRDVLEL